MAAASSVFLGGTAAAGAAAAAAGRGLCSGTGSGRVNMLPRKCVAANNSEGSEETREGNGALRSSGDATSDPRSRKSGFEAKKIIDQAKDTSFSSLEGSSLGTSFGFGQYSHDEVVKEEDESRKGLEGVQPSEKPDSLVTDAEEWKNVFPAYLHNECDGTNGRLALEAAASLKELESRVNHYPLPSIAPSLKTPPCSSAQPPKEGGKHLSELVVQDPIWAAIRAEARLEAEMEPLLSSFLYASILAHSCFERSVGFVLANRLKNPTLLATQLLDVFDDIFMHETYLREAIRLDVQAVKDRDPACKSYSWALLYLKGYHALQSHRVSHALWNRGQRVLALALQSRISEVFAVDIHPAARIGKAVMLDHGTGVVIGETCVIGDRVSLMQGVTLGGTGKEAGDRHPKIEEGVLIGAGATILGNITIGRCSMVAAGSLVLKDVPPNSVAAGTPAKVVGRLKEPTPALTMKHDCMSQISDENLCEGAGI